MSELHLDDDPKWSDDERSIAEALRDAGIRVSGGGENEHNNRRPDFTLDDGLKADGKTLRPGAGSGTMVNRAKEVVAKEQARVVVFDLRRCGLGRAEAERGIRRIAGAYGKSGVYHHHLDRIIVIGDGYYLDEVIG
ncbi:MAG: hypothetical protein LBK54_06005 [Propionibacteriaceae bacterium]|nr:hypothetical protein [Propionibacteriaceae bacterium]